MGCSALPRLTSDVFVILFLCLLMILRSTCFKSPFCSSCVKSLQAFNNEVRSYDTKGFARYRHALSTAGTSIGESALSKLPNSLPKSEKNALPVDKVNAGIRMIKDSKDILLLWKTSNVALSVGESLFRPASAPVADWITNQFPRCNFSILFHHLLSTDISGIVVVSKSDCDRGLLLDRSALNSNAFTYEAVIHEQNLPTGNTVGTVVQHVPPVELFQTLSDRLTELTDSTQHTLYRGEGDKIAVNKLSFTVIQSAKSGTFGTLSLVNITFSGQSFPSLITPTFIEDSLSSVGLCCVREGKRPYLSLVGIQMAGEKGLTGREPTPSKFLKLIRREEILFHRLNPQNALPVPSAFDSLSSVHCAPSTSGLPVIDGDAVKQSVIFDRLRILVSDSALQPRNSSAVLVGEAVSEIFRMHSLEDAAASRGVLGVAHKNRRYRVLDLGCGSGALLLATLARLVPLSIEAIGVGVDLDLDALRTAERNAELNSQTACEWIPANFGELHLDGVRSRLVDAVLQCEGRYGSRRETPEYEGEADGDGLFDVILCNPPFLSDRAARGRVTAEGKRVLVGGISGMDPYIAICKSINMDLKSSRVSSAQQIKSGVSSQDDRANKRSSSNSSGTSSSGSDSSSSSSSGGKKRSLVRRLVSAASSRAATSERSPGNSSHSYNSHFRVISLTNRASML
jgi:methylase of polypeptide subunit release factors